jgi:hypothetical protein
MGECKNSYENLKEIDILEDLQLEGRLTLKGCETNSYDDVDLGLNEIGNVSVMGCC